VTQGTLYKFTLLKQSIFRSSWEIWHSSFLKNPILICPMWLVIGLIGLPQDKVADPRYPKSHRYNRFNIKLLEGKKKHAFKDHYSKDHTSIVKGKSPTTRCILLVFTSEFLVSYLTYVFLGQCKYIKGLGYIFMSLYVTVSFSDALFLILHIWCYTISAKSIGCCKFMLLILSYFI